MHHTKPVHDEYGLELTIKTEPPSLIAPKFRCLETIINGLIKPDLIEILFLIGDNDEL